MLLVALQPPLLHHPPPNPLQPSPLYSLALSSRSGPEEARFKTRRVLICSFLTAACLVYVAGAQASQELMIDVNGKPRG
jgi:hypothetical protein